ncbi:ImuA family protein [Pseudocnuella soli]|uniref:ImuA family protein n=1 Tax=Pseudocnuella soli TaxID=2502779 RepID=UPI001049F6F9|nr:Error-prone repair protein ImuA [Pseudocnuella soli]
MYQKTEILSRLRQDIASLQGYRAAPSALSDNLGLGPINRSMPNAAFPFKSVHEFICPGAASMATSSGFISGLLSSAIKNGGICLWVGSRRSLFPPALKLFGINPHQIFFIHLPNAKQVLWAIEEALKCTVLTAVVGEIQHLDFTSSRRLQLAVEKSGVACFLLRTGNANTTTASVTRWQVTPLPSIPEAGMPGVGHPRWRAELLKVRNGKPGTWELEWRNGRFRHPSKLAVINGGVQKKAG